MKHAPWPALALSLVLTAALSCAAARAQRATAEAPAAQPAASASVAPRVEVAAPDPPGPPPRVTAPMPGDPSSADLAGARLVTEACSASEEARLDIVRSRVEVMRAALDEELKNWLATPTCDSLRTDPATGTAIGDSFGAGGLGLSGVGEGGGGSGVGIGLGSIGTVGFGSGHGRLGGAPHAASASGTNNQVAGVDEADIVKNDGAYVYLAMNGALRIVEAMHPRLVSVTRLSGTPRNMLVDGDRAVVFLSSASSEVHACTYGYDCAFAGDGSSTSVVVLDVSDRAKPRIVRRIDASGSLMAARRIDHTVHFVVADNDSPVASYETWLDDLPECRTNVNVARTIARFDELRIKNERKIRAAAPRFPTLTEHGKTRQLCDVMHTALGDGEAFTSVVSFDIKDDKGSASAATVQSRPGAVFASQDGLYLSVVHKKQAGRGRWYGFFSSLDEVSDVHKFRIGARPADTRYVGSGVVPGHVLNQFAMDEWYGYLRVATTRGRVPDPSVESAVSVLAETEAGSLVRVGAVDHIAPTEDIRAVRFDGDRGYVVTFKKTDPLFVLDLHRPAEPAILGELKIPGFSTYLHRLDATHLLSIGFDANDHGHFAYFDGVILQLFDVTRPTEPVLLHKEKIGTRGSSSEAATDHLAFNYFAEKGLLAIPMTICEGGADGIMGDTLTFSGLLIYNVSVEGGFQRLGGVDHGKAGARCGRWWSDAGSAVKRSIFMDDLVFSIAGARMKVGSMKDLGMALADIPLAP